jgi:hypothetical protein
MPENREGNQHGGAGEMSDQEQGQESALFPSQEMVSERAERRGCQQVQGGKQQDRGQNSENGSDPLWRWLVLGFEQDAAWLNRSRRVVWSNHATRSPALIVANALPANKQRRKRRKPVSVSPVFTSTTDRNEQNDIRSCWS